MSQNTTPFPGSNAQQAPPLPGLHLQQQVQGTPAFQSQGAPAAISSSLPDEQSFVNQHPSLFKMLQALPPEQLKAFESMMLSNASCMPSTLPPQQPPSFGVTPSTFKQSESAAASTNAQHSSEAEQDREDGELEEGEDITQSAGPEGLHTTPTSLNEQQFPHTEQRPSASAHQARGGVLNNVLKAKTDKILQNHKKSQVDVFLKEAVGAGYTFDDFARGVDTKRLRSAFERLKLPVHQSQIGSQNNKSSAQILPVSSVSSKYQANNLSSSDVPKPGDAKAATSRAEYLARLQAAKSKRSAASPAQATQNGVTTAKPTTTLPSTASTTASVTGLSNTHVGVDTSKVPVPKGKAVDREALNAKLRERLEKMRSMQTAKAANNQTSNDINTPNRADTQRQELPGLGRSESGKGPVKNQVVVQSRAEDTSLSTQSNTPPSMLPDKPPVSAVAAPLPVQTAPFTSPETSANHSFTLPGLFMAANQTVPESQSHPLHFETAPTGPQLVANTGYFGEALHSAHPGDVHSRDESLYVSSTESRWKSRKRAVAADFDSPPQVAKRPFGQSRPGSTDDEMIIDISEDSDESDEDQDVVPGMATTPSQVTGSIRDFPPLSERPSRYNPRNHGLPASPATSGAITPGGLEYQRKMAEIEEMKRKLAEAELRRKGKATATPALTITSADSTTLQSSLDTTIQAIAPVDIVRSANVDAKESEMAALDAAPGTPAKNEKMQEKALLKQRLAELHRETAQARDKANSTPVTESVVRANAVAHAPEATIATTQMHYQGDYALSEPVPDSSSDAKVDHKSTMMTNSDGETSVDAGPNDTTFEDNHALSNGHMAEVAIVPPKLLTEHEPVENPGTNIDSSQDTTGAQATLQSAPSLAGGNKGNVSKADPIEEAATVASVEHAIDSNQQIYFTSAQGNHRESEGESEAMDESSDEDSDVSTDESSDSSSDHDMSHSLGHPIGLNDMHATNHAAVGTSDDHVQQPSHTSPDEENTSDSSMSDHFYDQTTPAPQETTQIEPSPMQTDQDDGEDEYEPESPSGLNDNNPTPDLFLSSRHETNEDDDLAPELQPNADQQVNVDSAAAEMPPSHRYKPYCSALKHFKDYRYHPQYLSNVPGGFKSLTYNHKIDPDNPLCPFEASGGICNDPSCGFQHFAGMAFTDNELIRTLGTEYGSHHANIRNEWNKGLTTVINELKNSPSSKDVNAIAKRIVEFRREFLTDKDVVLDMDWWGKKQPTNE